jgi:hypothetical protein
MISKTGKFLIFVLLAPLLFFGWCAQMSEQVITTVTDTADSLMTTIILNKIEVHND